MPQYLVAIHHPDNYGPSAEGEGMVRDIDVLNEERWRLPALRAKSLRQRPGGEVVITHPTWMRPWRGGAKPSPPAARRSRCASSSRCQRNKPVSGEDGVNAAATYIATHRSESPGRGSVRGPSTTSAAL